MPMADHSLGTQDLQDYTGESEASLSISASDILEHLYCPRFSYFEVYLGIAEHQEKRFKVQQGRVVHEDKTRINPDYLRKKLGCIDRRNAVYISSSNGRRGIVDEVLFFKDGTAAPIDYKYAEYKETTFKNHVYQLVFYGSLIRERFEIPVDRGFIVYTRSRNKLVEVPLGAEMYDKLDRIIAEFLSIVQQGYYPGPTKYAARCLDCCYKNICEKAV